MEKPRFFCFPKSLPERVVILVLSPNNIALTGKNRRLLSQNNIMNQNIYRINQNSPPPEFRSCFKCRFEGSIAQAVCPQCGKRLFTATNVRWRGFFLLLIGLFLSGFMAAVAFFVSLLLMNAVNDPGSASRINGESSMLMMIYGIFGLVIVMGLTSMLMGIWQMIFGKRNRFLIWIFFALIILTLFAGGIFRILAE